MLGSISFGALYSGLCSHTLTSLSMCVCSACVCYSCHWCTLAPRDKGAESRRQTNKIGQDKQAR